MYASRTPTEPNSLVTHVNCQHSHAQFISCRIIHVVPFALLSRGWCGRCVRSVSGSYGRHATVKDDIRAQSFSSSVPLPLMYRSAPMNLRNVDQDLNPDA